MHESVFSIVNSQYFYRKNSSIRVPLLGQGIQYNMQIEFFVFCFFFCYILFLFAVLSIRQNGTRAYTEKCLINLIFSRSNETENNLFEHFDLSHMPFNSEHKCYSSFARALWNFSYFMIFITVFSETDKKKSTASFTSSLGKKIQYINIYD